MWAEHRLICRSPRLHFQPGDRRKKKEKRFWKWHHINEQTPSHTGFHWNNTTESAAGTSSSARLHRGTAELVFAWFDLLMSTITKYSWGRWKRVLQVSGDKACCTILICYWNDLMMVLHPVSFWRFLIDLLLSPSLCSVFKLEDTSCGHRRPRISVHNFVPVDIENNSEDNLKRWPPDSCTKTRGPWMSAQYLMVISYWLPCRHPRKLCCEQS